MESLKADFEIFYTECTGRVQARILTNFDHYVKIEIKIGSDRSLSIFKTITKDSFGSLSEWVKDNY